MEGRTIPLRLLLLGSGTSQGVPVIGCDCDTCTSDDPRDARMRPSALITAGGSNILIDTSADFRRQMLAHRIRRLDAVLFTHAHFDHVGGFDDVRQFNVIQNRPIDCYGEADTLRELKTTFRYAFGELLQEGGGVPEARLHPIGEGMHRIAGAPVRALRLMHGKLPILGFRIGGIAYATDASAIPAASMDQLRDLDLLVIDALRHRPHPTHFSLEESIAAAREIGARETIFTHLAHDIHSARDSRLLPEGMRFGYDGLTVECGGSA